MAIPLQPTSLQLLVAPCGQLSGDGQLRELMQERRRHHGDDSGGLWYLPPARLADLGSNGGSSGGPGASEALAIQDPGAAVWLQLRFGGTLQRISLSNDWLHNKALELPAPAPMAGVC